MIKHAEASPDAGRRKVIVAGAGMSGLIAAFELEQAGWDVTLVEARARVGGRVHTQRGRDGAPIAEAGAGRIPRSHRFTIDLIERMGLQISPLHPSINKNAAVINGERWPISPETDLADAVSLPAVERQLGYDGLVKSYLLENVQRVIAAGSLDSPAWPPEGLMDLDDLSIVEYLEGVGASSEAIKLLTLGAFPTAISPLMLSRVLAHYDRDGLSIIVGGNDRLPEAIAARLRGKVHLNTQVRSVRQSSIGVNITVSSNDRLSTLVADAFVCTIPFSVLGDVTFDPPLSTEKQNILRDIRYISATKVAFRTRSRFWERQGFSGFAQLDTAAEIWSPQWPSNGDQGVLQFYQQGDRALALDAMSESEKIEHAFARINDVFPGLEGQIDEAVSYSWQSDPWARGAYGIPRPGQLYRWKGVIGATEGRIFFAGEHTSEYSAWIEGAVRSGMRAAEEVQHSFRHGAVNVRLALADN